MRFPPSMDSDIRTIREELAELEFDVDEGVYVPPDWLGEKINNINQTLNVVEKKLSKWNKVKDTILTFGTFSMFIIWATLTIIMLITYYIK